MKTIVLALTFLLATSSSASAQSKENLRGLKGVRLMVMLDSPHRLDEAQWPELLKMVQADAIAKLNEAGIPVFGLGDKRNGEKDGNPRLVIRVPQDNPDSSSNVTSEVELVQNVRLSRDPSIETDAVTWSRGGFLGGPRERTPRMRVQIADLVDQFVRDYQSVNPKESAASTKPKSK